MNTDVTRQGKRRVRAAAIAAAVAGAVAATVGGVVLARHGRAQPGAAAATDVGPFHVGAEVQSRARLAVTLDLGRAQAPQTLELDGDWTATVTDVHDGVAEVACALSNLRAAARDGAGAAPGGELTRELARPFFVTQASDGAVVGVWLPRDMKPAVANILLTLAGGAQLVRPTSGLPAWVVKERDVNGAYMAAYQEIAPGRFHKQKARYLEAGGANAQAPRIRVDRSETDLRADPGGRLLEVDARETLAIELGNLTFGVTTTLALDRAQVRAAPALAGAFARAREGLQEHPMGQLGLDPAAERAQSDARLLAGASLDDLVAELATLPAAGAQGGHATSALTARFEALFRLRPDAAGRAPAIVRAATKEHGKVVIDALSVSQTDAGQVALAALAGEATIEPTLRLYAVQYLGLEPHPAAAAVTALAALQADHDAELAQAALLAYAACARSLRGDQPARAKTIGADLLQRLARAADEPARFIAVVALGNAADPASVSALRPLVAGDAPALRAPAIKALRFIDDPAVDPLLASLLQNTSPVSARLAAIGAIRFRQVGPFTMALADLARRDASVEVRHAAIDLLGSRLKDLPTLRPVLEQVAKNDGEPRNRSLASRYLGG